MEKISIDVTVYEFGELPENVKKKMIEKEFTVLADIWEPDFLIDSFVEKLESIGFENAKIFYSIGGGQGDGACFDADVNLEKICKHLNIDYDSSKNGWVCNIKSDSRRYSHERTRHIEFYNNGEDANDIEDEINKFAIEELRLNLCHEIYNDLYKYYQYETSEEQAIEFLKERKFIATNDIAEYQLF